MALLDRTPERGLDFFGSPGVSSNGVVSLRLTNASASTIDFVVCLAQVRSNGVWSELRPPGGPLSAQRLPTGQSVAIAIAPPLHGEAWRVPIIWYYVPTKLQVMKKKAEFFLAGGGSWNLVAHTNLSPEMTR